jgi:HSP20 family protein
MHQPKASRENRNQVSRLYDDPFQTLENRLNQLIRNVFEVRGIEADLGNYPVDVDEDDDHIRIEAEMPGFKRDEVEVTVENGVLTIKAERGARSDDDQDARRKKHLSERRFTRVQRSFTLPRTVDGSDVDASLDDGVLTLTLKKTEESKPRRIEIRGAE